MTSSLQSSTTLTRTITFLPKTRVYTDRLNNDAAETEIIDGKATFVQKNDLDPTTVMSAKMMANPTLAKQYLEMKESAHMFANNKVVFVRIIRQMFELGITFAFHSASAHTIRHSDMTEDMKQALGSWYCESITSMPEPPEPQQEVTPQISDYQLGGPSLVESQAFPQGCIRRHLLGWNGCWLSPG